MCTVCPPIVDEAQIGQSLVPELGLPEQGILDLLFAARTTVLVLGLRFADLRFAGDEENRFRSRTTHDAAGKICLGRVTPHSLLGTLVESYPQTGGERCEHLREPARFGREEQVFVCGREPRLPKGGNCVTITEGIGVAVVRIPGSIGDNNQM